METRKSSGISFAATRRRRRDTCEIRLHELPGGVLNFAVGDFVLNGVNQLDVADRTRASASPSR